MRRYNRLRKRGYRTIRGTNYQDSESGCLWTVLLMSNGKKMKRVKVRGAETWGWFQRQEYYS